MATRAWGAAAITAVHALLAAVAAAQSWDLVSPEGLELRNVAVDSVTFEGKRALRVTISPEAAKTYAELRDAPPPNAAAANAPRAEAVQLDHLVLVPGLELGSGTIEVDLAGAPGAGAVEGARGFVGVAFRVQHDRTTYDAFYLRPTNGRADDQERRNHAAQYISHPGWPWYRLRRETPGRYESYVDIEPAKWIHVKVVIEGERARLYVDGAEQPTLIVKDLKSGAGAKGQVGLWLEGSTVAHFANLRVTR